MSKDSDIWVWILGWCGLICMLAIGTFGLWTSIFIFINILSCMAGFCGVIWYVASRQGKHYLSHSLQSDLGLPSRGLPSVLEKVEQEKLKHYKMDKRLTGANIIDEPLQEVIEYFFRDYIRDWYDVISEHEEFLYDLRQTLQKVLISLASRSKEVEWVPYLTVKLVDDFATHLKLFGMTIDECGKSKEDGGEKQISHMKSIFFQKEHEMFTMCRGDVCLDKEKEKEYLRTVSDLLLYLLLPPGDFHNKPFRFFLREVIACNVLLPTVEMVCDPDYINQTIIMLCQENSFTVEGFLTIIRSSDDVNDVEEIKARVIDEIARLRSRDSESTGEAAMAIRQQLSSMLFVKKICEAQIKNLKTGNVDTSVLYQENPDSPLLPLGQNLLALPLQDILDNNTALSYFIAFTEWAGGQEYLNFWLVVESFRVTAEQQLSIHAEKELQHHNTSPKDALRFSDVESVREAALSIYDQYLSDVACPKVELDEKVVKQTLARIRNQQPSAEFFDCLQKQAFMKLQQDNIYGSFLRSRQYLKCLLHLGLLKEKSDEPESSNDEVSFEENDEQKRRSGSSSSDFGNLWTRDEEIRLTACISKAGICNDGNKSYGVYAISVYRASSEGTVTWTIARRYSDFDDLHVKLKEKFPSLGALHLPKKRSFRNIDRDFLEKRKQDLDRYLQKLLSPEYLDAHPGMYEVISNFLELGKYVQEKGHFSRTVNTVVAPLRSSVHNVSHAIKTVPEGITGGFHKVSGGLHKVLGKNRPGFSQKSGGLDYSTISANIENEDEDNIPLRILLLLMDELFDLKHRNLWLRRRIVIVLKQIIKTTFGDTINRKIVDHVEGMTSAKQIAEYVRLFRDAYWPNGILAEEYPERSASVKSRTRVTAKTMMLGSLPDDLKRFLGNDVSKDGVFRVFDTFQHPELNKRLLYVISEGFLELLYPENNFPEMFKKLHCKEHRTKKTT